MRYGILHTIVLYHHCLIIALNYLRNDFLTDYVSHENNYGRDVTLQFHNAEVRRFGNGGQFPF